MEVTSQSKPLLSCLISLKSALHWSRKLAFSFVFQFRCEREFLWISDNANPSWFGPNKIHLPKGAAKKVPMTIYFKECGAKGNHIKNNSKVLNRLQRAITFFVITTKRTNEGKKKSRKIKAENQNRVYRLYTLAHLNTKCWQTYRIHQKWRRKSEK